MPQEPGAPSHSRCLYLVEAVGACFRQRGLRDMGDFSVLAVTVSSRNLESKVRCKNSRCHKRNGGQLAALTRMVDFE